MFLTCAYNFSVNLIVLETSRRLAPRAPWRKVIFVKLKKLF